MYLPISKSTYLVEIIYVLWYNNVQFLSVISEYEDLYLVIHNIDGPMLRPEKTQAVLSLLAQIRGFHILASIDHINAPLSKFLPILGWYSLTFLFLEFTYSKNFS